MSTEAERQKEADAREKFQEDLASWNQRKAERAEFLANRQKEIAAAAASDIEKLNILFLYQQYFGPNNTAVAQNADPAPTLAYTPSDQTKSAKIIGITIGMALTTYTAYKIDQRN